MSYLLFMDESGHDHRTMPYEVRGGILVHARQIWPLISSLRRLERSAFGCYLEEFGSELKGERLLRSKNFKFAAQEPPLSDIERQESARRFLSISTRGHTPSRRDFTAYGQACAYFNSRFFRLLVRNQVRIIASMVPKGANRGASGSDSSRVRRDQLELLDRYYRFLEDKGEMGLLVLDETDRTDDRRYLRRMEQYFLKSARGREQASKIVPTPLFVASDMSYAIQAADIVIYCVNWGFRDPERGIDAVPKQEVLNASASSLRRLQFRSIRVREDGSLDESFSIFCVPELFK